MPSRSVPSTFPGLSCPLEIQFGFVHGPSAAVAHIKLAGQILPPPGTQGMFYIGPSTFTGYVTNREYDPIEDETSIRMVDWRDRLHDSCLRCAWNMQEADGRYYHIFPKDWLVQRKTYVTKDLGQFDFRQFQSLPPQQAFQTNIGRMQLYSAFTLLDWIAAQIPCRITADPLALQMLRQSYPLNMDFNNGSTTVGNAIQAIVAKVGMQFTCFGQQNLHVTIRGIANNTFSAGLAQGFANICALGVSSGKIGDELNELGRRVQIIGDKNLYEYVFLCRANWNPAWTWGMVFGGIELGKLLGENNLTEFDKVGKLPQKYRDEETYAEADEAGKGALPARKTRNLMTIREYLEKIAFKAYVVEARAVIQSFTTVVPDKFDGQYFILDAETLSGNPDQEPQQFADFPRALGYNVAASNLLYPLARNLVTDSNLQFLVYATTRNIVRGKDSPFGTQHAQVPRSQGVSLDVEEVVNPTTGRAEYRVRVFFNQPQVWLPPGKSYDDPKSVEADFVLARLCLEKDFYTYQQGEQANNVRVREQTVSVRNLYKAFLHNQEQTVLQQNFRRDLQKGGQSLSEQPVKADDIARQIARQLLFHEAITKSGNLTFDDQCGNVPDGIIDSVTVNYSAAEGVTESVNFTSGLADDRNIQSPIPVKLSRPFRNEEELARDRLKVVIREAMKDKAMAGKVMAIMDTGLHEPGALIGVPIAALAYGKGGIVKTAWKPDVVQATKERSGGSVVLLTKPE